MGPPVLRTGPPILTEPRVLHTGPMWGPACNTRGSASSTAGCVRSTGARTVYWPQIGGLPRASLSVAFICGNTL
eukprot:1525111-Alexandrium_andersonii.AAC.1